MKDERWEELYFQELSEDRRHAATMLWEIPVAIFLVNSFLLSMISMVSLSFTLRRVVISFGLTFTTILTWSLFKVVRRAYQRAEELKAIENKRGLSRYGKIEPWYLRFPLGYIMFLLLLVFIAFLAYLIINPQFLSPAN